MMHFLVKSFFPLAGTLGVTALLFLGSHVYSSKGTTYATDDSVGVHDSAAMLHIRRSLANHLEFTRMRDTVYVFGDRFVEVSLARQIAIVRYRTGDTIEIPISSGNPAIKDGIETSQGIFSVQNKTPLALSRQFANAKMLWWIGFNYNIGFHGLEANGYYRYLGKRPSSHGCLRVGREDVERLYKLVEINTPVIVYNTEPARIFAFADSTTIDTTKALKLGSRNKTLQKLMDKRLELLYQGKRVAQQRFSVYLSAERPLRPGGYAAGTSDSLLNPQERPAPMTLVQYTMPQDHFSQDMSVWEHRALFQRTAAAQADSLSATENMNASDSLVLSQQTPSKRKAAGRLKADRRQ